MKIFEEEKLKILGELIKDFPQPNILELGVQNGNSTRLFLEYCDKNDGNLVSIDIEDCSKVSDSKRWKFIHSSDDNFSFIDDQIGKKKFDILFIDSLHEPKHVRNIFFHYFKYININGLIIIDDVVWLPYVKYGECDNDFIERINRLTFDKILEIYNSNKKNITLDIKFNGTGLAVMKKIKSDLFREKKIKNRLFTLKNILKFLYAPKPKK